MPDSIGNTLSTALPINLGTNTKTFTDSVEFGDVDYYKFTLNKSSSFNLALSGLSANADVAILDSIGDVVSVGGVQLQSSNKGSLIETINTVLAPGTYFIRVVPGSPTDPTAPASTTPSTNYTLNVQSDTGVRTDLVWRNYNLGANGIWRMEGTTLVSTVSIPTVSDTSWVLSGSGDFTNDGIDDLVWRYYGESSVGSQGIWQLDSSGQIVTTITLPSEPNPNLVIAGVGDLNGDAIPDIIFQDISTGAVSAWLLNSSFSIASTVTIGSPMGAGWFLKGIGDFNSDNNPDLLWHSNNTGANLVWFLNGSVFASSTSLLATVPSTTAQVVGDFNGDGQVDILFRSFSTGQNDIWLMNGTSLTAVVPIPTVADVTWQANAPLTRSLPIIQKDGAGNTLETALNISTLNGNGTYRDSITAADPNDYYQFSLNSQALVGLNLNGLGGGSLADDLNVQILNSSGGVVASSNNGSTASEVLTNVNLASGTYYVRVFAGQTGAVSPYELGLQVNNPPVLISSGPITVSESASQTIGNTLLLVTDANNPPIELTYQLLSAPDIANGNLLLNGATISTGNLFTQQDINQGRLVYQQNGGEGALSDRFIFGVSDGAGGTIPDTTFRISIIPVNDPPVLVSFAAATVSEGLATTISSSSLLVTDVEQAASQIIYSLNSLPTKGTLLLNVLGGAQPLALNSTFTQADITSNNLIYQHDGSETYNGSGSDIPGNDNFTFTVTDGAGGFLVPTTRTFSLSVLQVNDAPVVVTNTGTTVGTGSTRVITDSLLRATDAELLSAASQDLITFSVATAPTQGTLFLGATQTTTFTQADLNAGRVSYLHNSTSSNSDRFTFTVSDGTTTIAASTFEIFVLGVKGSPVLLTTNPGLTVNEGEVFTFSDTELNISDSDSAPPFLRYTVGSLAPANGQLAVAGAPISVGGTFTQNDINNGRVTYQQNGSETARDAFTFTFTDESGNTTLLAPRTFSINVLPVNDLPTLLTTNPQITVTEAGFATLSSTLLNATDPDNLIASEITYAVAAAPSGGTILLNGTAISAFTQADVNSNLVRYQQNGSEASSDSFSFTITDPSGTPVGPSVVNVSVVQVNDAPGLANNVTLTLNEGDTAALDSSNLLITDNDGPGPLTYTLGNGPLRGVLRSGNTTLSAGDTFSQLDLDNGQVFYINNGSEFTSDRFTFTASDGATSGLGAPGLIGLTTFSINVLAGNDAPIIATNTGITLSESGLVTITKSILNATDVDNVSSQLTFNVSSSPANGTLLKAGTATSTFTQADVDGNLISYKHSGSETTTDNFVFDVVDRDGAAADIQTFNISVIPVNDAPGVALNTGATVDEGNTLIISDSTLLITDPDGPALSPVYTLSTAPTRGVLVRDGATLSSGQTFTQADISATLLSYVNNGGEFTSDRFTFTASDGSTGILPLNTFNLTINPVNDAPIITVPTAALLNVNEDTQFTFSGVNRINATDPDSTPLTVTLSSEFGGTLGLGSTSGLAGLTGNNTGAISFRGTPGAVSGALNNLRYKGTQDFNGTEQITIEVTDGTTPTSRVVTMNVVAVNDAPTLTVPTATIVVGEDLPTAALNLTLTDVDSADSPIRVTLTASNGTLTVNDNGLLNFVTSNNGSSVVSFTGLVADVQTALAGLVYQGNPNYFGPDRIAVTVDDQGATGLSLGSSAVTRNISLNVTSINDKPTFTPSATSYVINESGSSTTPAPQVTVPNWATALSSGAANESQVLNFVVTGNDNPSLFQVAPTINASTGALTYTPRADANGIANVTVTLRDNGGTLNGGINASDPVVLSITINQVNDAPSFTKGGNQTINEDAAAVTVNNWASAIRTGPTTTLANESTQSVNFLVSTSNDSLFSVAPTISPTGTLTYTAAPNAFGTAVVSVSLQDDGGTDNGGVDTSPVQLFTIVVRSVNDAPTFTPALGAPVIEVLEDDPVQSIQIAADLSVGAANEVPPQTLSFALANSNPNLFLSTARPTIDATTGLLRFQTAPNAFGSAVITATLRDNGGTLNGGVDAAAPYVFTINVLPVNDAPSFTRGANQTVAEDSGPRTVNGWAGAITAGPGEGSSQAVSFLVANDNPSLFSVAPTISPTGTLTYTAAPDANGTAIVTVQLTDNGGTTPGDGQDTSAPQLFTIVVTPVNDRPTLTLPGPQTVQEDPLTPFEFTGANAIQFTDVDSGSSPVRVVLSVQQGTVTLPQTVGLNVIGGTNGSSSVTFTGAIADLVNAFTSVSYQPNANFSGTDRLVININDQGATGSGTVVPAIGTVTINVATVNDDPVLVSVNTLTVGESSGVPANVIISNSLLRSTDVDNTDAQISYVVAGTPTAGQLRISTGSGFTNLTTGSQFTQADINNNRLRYAQDGSEATSDSFTFQISDGGTLLPATPTTFNIAILPFNDPPRAVVNTGLTLSEESGSAILDNLLLFTDVDNSNPADLLYTLESNLNSGELQFGGTPLTQGQTFTQEDINNGLLIYQNSGSESPTDGFNFSVTDGNSTVLGSFNIAVLAVNDAPAVISAGPLSLSEGGTLNLRNLVLTTDPDNLPSQIRYTLQGQPTFGELRRSGVSLGAGAVFTQQEIDNGTIAYLHNGSERPSDFFSFLVSDGTAAAISDVVDITITSVNDAPILVTNLPLTLASGTPATRQISSSILRATDDDNTPAQVFFRLGSLPTAGEIRRNGSPLTAGATFSQKDIADGIVTYRYSGVGSSDGFSFTVVDSLGKVGGSGFFQISFTS